MSDYAETQIEQAEKQIFNEKPDLSWSSIKNYFLTRPTTLIDIPFKRSEQSLMATLNPIDGLRELTPLDWNMYFVGFVGWSIDAFDFFVVSASIGQLLVSLNVSSTSITWGITLVLMFRSLGALIFGFLSDAYGRKWTYIAVCVMFTVIELGTGFVKTYAQFLGVRALFGIAMGAFYPVCATTALEDQPTKARSVLSGLFLPGYNVGYILAVVFFRAFENTYKENEGWRSLFWFTAGLPILLIIWRLCLPETTTYHKVQLKKKLVMEKKKQEHQNSGWFARTFDTSIFTTMKTEWLLFSYLIVLMSALNFSTHSAQDLMVLFLEKQRQLSTNGRTVIMVIGNVFGVFGGIIFGMGMEIFGRRLTIMMTSTFTAVFVYGTFISKNRATILICNGFMNAGIMGGWGVAPVHLLELVNPSHRAMLSGLTYQLGNLVSSASSTIESNLGSKYPITLDDGTPSHDYGKVMGIFVGSVMVALLIIIFLGPERFHRDLRLDADAHSIVAEESDINSNSDNSMETKEKIHHIEEV